VSVVQDPRYVHPLPAIDRPSIHIYIVFTTWAATKAGLNMASQLARDLDANVILLVPIVVPYPLPIQSPPVASDFIEGELSGLTEDCGVAVSIHVLLCRDREETVPSWLPPGAVVVIGRARRWGPGSCRRLIQGAKKQDRRVIVVGTDQSHVDDLACRGRKRR